MSQEEIETNEEENEETEVPVGMILQQGPPTLSPEESLRLELLNLSKDILLGKAAMRWETHKQYGDVTVTEIIEEAQRMFAFVRGDE
jgi:hypothetical protein